ncbi:beta strand repeat-containing protein [Nitrosomonas ureae]|uniref:Repeat domain-containing protein n=1 Tax=Nitrosomonas ureae TaxID=44577 RepID=A0A286ABX2_9PROT|nr:FG-GAP-like repeat-containing protein [Nitrosomonas ureae]SOD19404.1 Repeat domain-containing protein [Nitrosomonas ureae]
MSDPNFTKISTSPFVLSDVGQYASPTFADIDGDGDLDAFVGNSGGQIFFFQNTGTTSSPVFAAANINLPGLTNVTGKASPTLVDIDNDGDLDAFIGEGNGNTRFFLNTGTTSNPLFAAASTNPFGLNNVGNSATPVFVDIDGDGDQDAFVGNVAGDTLFFRNTGTINSPVFGVVSTNPFGLSNIGVFANPSFVDINGDGDFDAFVSNNVGNTLFFENTGTANNPVFAVASTNPFGLIDVGTGASPAFSDIDNDGDQDVFMGNGFGNTLFLQNIGTTGNAIFSTYPFGLSFLSSYATLTFVDIDSDDDMDAFVGNQEGNLLFFRNTGTASSPALVADSTNPFGLTDVGSKAHPNFVDIDSDGDLDAFVGNLAGNILFYRNIGTVSSPSFSAAITNPFGLINMGGEASPSLVDIDSDGDLDVFVGIDNGFDHSNTLFFKNIGTASTPIFSYYGANTFGLNFSFDRNGGGAPSSGRSFVDIDGDGDYDAFLNDGYGDTIFFRNAGTISNPVFAIAERNPFGFNNNSYYFNPVFVDIDGDGDLDSFAVDRFGNTSFSQNSAPGVNVLQSAGTTVIAEDGATDTYTVALRSAPASEVTVTLTTNNSQISSSLSVLTFTPINWDIPQTVTISAVNDTAGEGKHTSAINYTVNSGDPNYHNIAVDTTRISITDNDLPAVDPMFTLATTNPFGLSNAGLSASPTFVDIDSDGDVDAFVGNQEGNTLFYRNTGTASSPVFAAASINPFGLSEVGSNAKPTFADTDGDGDLDAFVGNVYGEILYSENIGTIHNPVFDIPSINPFGLNSVYGGVASPALIDIDGDEDLDAFVGNSYGNALFFKNTGTVNNPVFAAAKPNRFGLRDVGSNASPTFTDIDGDGDWDAFMGNSAGNTLFFRNTGTASNPKFAAANVNRFGLSDVGYSANPTFVDIDSDGDLDAFVGNNDGNLQFYVNNGLLLTSTVGNDILAGTPSNNDTVTYGLAIGPVTVSLSNTNPQNTLGAGLDTLTAIENIIGSAFNDILTGNAKNNTLTGRGGHDTLNGAGGADVMAGGFGNDVYTVNVSGDAVMENFNQGSDKINSSVTYTLPAHVENLTLTGAGVINGTGNDLANILIGNTGNNQLDGGAGNNTLTGGLGNDIFKFTTAGHVDVITDYNVTNDTIQLENAVFTALTVTGTLAAARFRIGANALDANDNIIYNSITGALIYDANGNGAGAAVQIATIGVGLALTHADIVVI